MITKNWYKTIATLMFCERGASWDVGILGTGGVSSAQYFYNNASFSYAYNLVEALQKIDTDYEGSGVRFGTGNTPVTLDDYKLSGDIITTLSGAYSISKGADAAGAYITALYTLTNTGSSDVTVSEVGTFVHINKTNSSTHAYPMIDRTVLDTPVTIPAGGIGQVVYTITFNYPTAT